MTITVSHRNGLAIATIAGILDEESRAPFEEQLHPLVIERGSRLVLDLSGVPRATSMGLGQLVALVARANTKGSRVVLAAPTPFVRSVLAVSKLDNFFEVVDTVSDAESRLS